MFAFLTRQSALGQAIRKAKYRRVEELLYGQPNVSTVEAAAHK